MPEIAFAGRSNAGKSSAINALANHGRLAFASRTPGRTQQINIFALRSGALVADLPGYGYAAVAKSVKRDWQDFLWQYVTHAQRTSWRWCSWSMRGTASAISTCAVLDADSCRSGRPVLILATKADKLGTSRAARSARSHRQRSCTTRFRWARRNVERATLLGGDAARRRGGGNHDRVVDSCRGKRTPRKR